MGRYYATDPLPEHILPTVQTINTANLIYFRALHTDITVVGLTHRYPLFIQIANPDRFLVSTFKDFNTAMAKALFFTLALLLALPACDANLHSHLQSVRGMFLALELVENRCPLQKAAFLGHERSFGVSHLVDFRHINRRMLAFEKGELEADELVSELQNLKLLPSSRKLLAARSSSTDLAHLNKDAFRVSACQTAWGQVEAYCEGAPDDQGPGSIMPWLEYLECPKMEGAVAK